LFVLTVVYELRLLIKSPSVFRYAQVRNAGTEAVQRSVRQGVDLKVKKSDVLTRLEEQLMLNNEGASLDHPKGLNNRFVYFCCNNFFIRGQNELRDTCAHQFELQVNGSNEEFLR
jgi:hypothetical protein